jgi:hypothetical protein
MKIVGFGQVMRFDQELTMRHEIKVIMTDGREVSVPTNEETVQALINLWGTEHVNNASSIRHSVTDSAGEYPDSYVAANTQSPPADEFGGDIGEIKQKPALSVVPDDMGYPVVLKQQATVPTFLREEDEDGQQI